MNQVRPRPVRRHRAPRYPTKLEVLREPGLLETHVPAGWLSHRELAGVVGACLAANTVGCSTSTSANAPNAHLTDTGPASVSMVAPVYGGVPPKILARNRGSSACVAVAPPVFLSEEEALQIIVEELSQQGLTFSDRNVPLKSVIITWREYERKYDWISETRRGDIAEVTKPLQVDRVDPDHQVGVEYIDSLEAFHLGEYEPHAAAASVAAEVAKQGSSIRFGAFYDPSKMLPTELRWAHGEKREEATAECQRLLRLQVKSFIDWLKGQGVI